MNKLKAVAASLLAFFAAPSSAVEINENISIGGSVRVNYNYIDYSESSKDKYGDIAFDTLSLTASGQSGKWGFASEYRLNNSTDYLILGYASYDFSPDLQIQGGVTHVPFGNPGYISNSWWMGLPYYLGFEDDRDVGVKATYQVGGGQTDVAFFKSPEYGASNNERYAADLFTGTINGTDYNNEETNQFNIRHTQTFGSLTVGASGQYGQIYNSGTGNTGDRFAVAAHLNGNFGSWNVQMQAMHYEFDAADAQDENKIGMSVVGWQYEVAAKGQIYNVNIAKSVATDWGSLKFYNDFGLLTPDVEDASYDNSFQNVTGVAIAAGPTYTMVDFIAGKNMTFSTANNDHIGLPEIGDDWDFRININLGYYF